MDLLWFDQVLLSKHRFGDFDDLRFVNFLQSFVSVSGLGRGAGAELHSDGPEFGGQLRHRLWNPWGPVFPAEVLLYLELGSGVSQNPASRVLHTPPSKRHSGPSKVFMIRFRHRLEKWTNSDRFLVWNATNACFWYIFRQGIIAQDFKSTMAVVWLTCQDEAIFLTGPPRPSLVVSDLSPFSKADKSHRAVK